MLLQTVDGRIVAEHVVAKLGPLHRLAHRIGGSGDCIASEVDHGERSVAAPSGVEVVAEAEPEVEPEDVGEGRLARLIASAMRMAAARLRVSAMPLPAMSKAVP